ncbi:MAG: YGGT family protein [candidate division WWE3 bacterium GW2011_GWF2_41_45]|uniref:YGGT family protein n=2 Tax=Katanobacteria TaxID=422282 RepID=A0A0G0Y004_UNCKA|nr:MAG: YGGT family protein [candidate division WWE3 bacterium GW2011_GWC2_41_23]KKS10022.1 MAG: YGGT family protein [candidate division WWE3 bacterium GW2011_GWF2_41_45]KKS11982.1 MAG: YGGT family protein [candidate division WWE3 bacterium GW2011_GWF1_41_53]KKS19872.1 MAG: YGGT family protein [candidate division WWE3 bacterium GW2011_GWE1_41_72]KKS28933.1 MAG: YGGT family protein [candidate division WWE3 bacterium GW2011_GWD2_42_11]KKS50344.1 MAG: YGGT family protein [candidate division WWE3 
MAEITKETIITENDNTETLGTTPGAIITNSGDSSTPVMATQVQTSATKSQTSEYLIYYIFGALEILLAFRLVLKLMGAGTTSGFVRFIYGLTGFFILPFEGIFQRAVTEGIETASVLEPATIVAIIVYACLAWGIVKLVQIFSGEKRQG